MRAPAKVGDLLPGLAKKNGWSAVVEVHRLKSAWVSIVGEAVAAHTTPEKISGKRLTVLVDSSPWLVQLGFYKRDILRKINNLLGGGLVGDLFFRVGKVKKKSAGTHKKPRLAIPAAVRKQADAYAGEVQDEGVRDALRRLILSDLRRGAGRS